jgi:hypothetical protein
MSRLDDFTHPSSIIIDLQRVWDSQFSDFHKKFIIENLIFLIGNVMFVYFVWNVFYHVYGIISCNTIKSLICVFQISLNGLEVLCLMVDRMGEDFKIHVSSGLY